MLSRSKIFLGVVIVHTYASLRSFVDNRPYMASAFVPKNVNRSYQCYPTSSKALHQIKISKPFPGSDVIVDHERAQYCVDHFGSCTIAEMESLKNGFHVERMQTLVSGHENDNSILESRLLEGELELQIALLKEQNSITDVLVIPTDEIEDEVLPNLHDTKTENMFHQPTPSEILVLEETILEENLLEPIAICCAIVALALLPQFI